MSAVFGGDGVPARTRAKRKSRSTLELWAYDTETDPFHNCTDLSCEKCHGGGRIPAPFLHGLYNGATDQYEEFETVEDTVAFLEARKALVYAHNGGKFDYHPLRDHMNSDQPVMVINGRISKFHIGECEFRDSLNIFPNTRLKDFGVKNDIDYALMEPGVRDDPNNRGPIRAYLKQDCVGLWQVVARYREEYGKKLTQASASMKYWEKMAQVEAPRQTKGQYDRYRPYYCGGRVQCFTSGAARRDFKVADINSAYPRAMKEQHMVSVDGIRKKHLPPEPRINRCLIKLDCTSRGALPWRDPETKEMYFPDDEAGHRKRMRTYTVTGWEFVAGLEENALSNIVIREVYEFTETVSFAEYIDHFYGRRMEAAARGDLAGKIFGKYFMNSLYGKFGANCSNYAEYVIASTDSYPQWRSKGYEEYKSWGQRFLMERRPTDAELSDLEGRWRYYNVATAASVTGWVRAYLFRSMMKCSDVLYCDTDSIAASDTAGLEFGKGLGQWKDEGAYDEYAIAGKKLYAFHRAGAPLEYDPTDEESPTWKLASKGVNLYRNPWGPEIVRAIATGATVPELDIRAGRFESLPESPCYSVTRERPVFISREVRSTYKDMSQAPDVGVERQKPLAPRYVMF